MGTIKIQQISFSYDGAKEKIFSNVNLAIDESWKLGLIGRNGRGKTTLLRILRGQLAYQGLIETNLQFNYFPAQIDNLNEVTQTLVLQILQIDESELWKVQIEMDQLGLNDDILWKPFSELSPGQQTKVLLAVCFSQSNQFALIDEPTNHLDAAGRQVVAKYLQQKIGFIIISHDRDFLNQVINHVISIDRQQIQLLKGNYDTWKTVFDQNNLNEANQKSKIEREVKQLQQSAAQTKAWAENAEKSKNKSSYQNQQVNLDKGFISHKAAKVMKKAQNTLRRTEFGITQKQELLKNVETINALSMNYTACRKTILTLQQLQVKPGNRVLLKTPLDISIEPGQRIILQGANGSGKSTILHAILDRPNLAISGAINWAVNVKVSYVSQTFDDLSGTLQDYTNAYHIELSEMLNMLRKLGFERETFNVLLQNMSMGQQRKISLARSMCEAANIYIWDEPLNYLDVIARQEIETLINDYQPTMIVVDHDNIFTQTIGTKFVSI